MHYEQFVIELRKNKALYYIKNLARQLIPSKIFRISLKRKLLNIRKYNESDIINRLNYYNKLDSNVGVGIEAKPLRTLKILKTPKAYNFDLYEYIRYFDQDLKANFLFGDITYIPGVPSILKSRPISDNNSNSIVLKLDKKRHFVFINDKINFRDKADKLIGRGAMTQSHRLKFVNMYFNNAICDLGHVGKHSSNAKWLKPKLSILEHLKYKFILSLEGNDVATNLKWIMSSNSIAVMPSPKFETWFMEGKLIPDFHYIHIEDDYSNLEQKLSYYIEHKNQAEAIIKNAHDFIQQFQDKKKEDLLALLVLAKYFKCTGQLNLQGSVDK